MSYSSESKLSCDSPDSSLVRYRCSGAVPSGIIARMRKPSCRHRGLSLAALRLEDTCCSRDCFSRRAKCLASSLANRRCSCREATPLDIGEVFLGGLHLSRTLRLV